jgi:hypothetical protein
MNKTYKSEPYAPNYSRVALTREGGVGLEETPCSVAWCYVSTPWMVSDERGGKEKCCRVICGLLRFRNGSEVKMDDML